MVLVEWDSGWPARFERERARICQTLGSVARRIEHIGSTSVPGLAAEPIVDILATVSNIDDEGAFVGRLERAGYILRVRSPAIACSARRIWAFTFTSWPTVTKRSTGT